MMKIRNIPFPIVTLSLVSCGVLLLLSACNRRNFKSVERLENYPNTKFVATLETPISMDKNVVYAASMPMVWDEVRTKIANAIEVEDKTSELELLHRTKSHQNVLDTDEYQASASVQGSVITAKAFFRKSLPFKKEFSSFKDVLKFKEQTVPAFGMLSRDDDLIGNIDILYFKSKDDFIIRLNSKDRKHEIILYKNPESRAVSLVQLINQVNKKVEQGLQERAKNYRKFIFGQKDELLIPKLSFHLEDNYKSLEGQSFKTDQQKYTIGVAYQRNAFILDEKGAKVESEAHMKVTTAEPPRQKPESKIMYFDDSFLVMLRKKDRENPYFAVWVHNTDFMK